MKLKSKCLQAGQRHKALIDFLSNTRARFRISLESDSGSSYNQKFRNLRRYWKLPFTAWRTAFMNQGKPELCKWQNKRWKRQRISNCNDPREFAFWLLKPVILSQELRNFFVNGSPLLDQDTNFNSNALLSTPTEFMENYQGEMAVVAIFHGPHTGTGKGDCIHWL